MVLPIKPVYIWLIIFIIMLIIEATTLGLASIWFAVGSLVALFVSFSRVGFFWQIIICVVVSVILLILVRPWALKRFNRRRTRTNAESLLDQDAVVIEDIDNLQAKGRALISGQEWSARSTDEARKIPKGTEVVVKEISGVKLIVEPKKESAEESAEENAEEK